MRSFVVLVAGLIVGTLGILTGCSSGGGGPTGDPSLTALAVDLGPFNETFDPGVTTYTMANTDFLTTQIKVTTATPIEADATVTVDGGDIANSVSLVEGRNIVSVRVVTTGGAARVYNIEVRRGSQANLAQQAYAKAANTGADDHFGYSVALDGDTMVVGTPDEDSAATGAGGDGSNNDAVDAGAVYVYVRNGTTWTPQAYLKALNTGAGDQFGWSVALEGDTLVVGAPTEDSAATGMGGNESDDTAADSGAVYVFVRSGTTWSQQAYVKASNTDGGDRFGWRVALSGDTMVVGALAEDSAAKGIGGDESDDNATNAGAVYVFTRSGTAWTQEAYVKASNTDAGDAFGISVALSGDTLAVGAVGESSIAASINGDDTSNTLTSSGAVYVFVRTGTAWQQQAYIKASNSGASDGFGASVALSGDTLAVGAPLEDGASTGVGGADNNGAPDSGAVYVFFRTGGINGTWQEQADVKASNTDAGDLFGWRVALSGDTLAVGAPAEDSAAAGVDDAAGVGQPDNNATTAGAVYVFTRSGTTWSQLDYVKASNTATIDGFGGSVAVSGNTLAVGAIGEDSSATGIADGNTEDNSAATSGAVYVFQ